MSNGDQFELFLRLMLALGLGAAIGMERELRGHEAGFRTIALVCVGAAFFSEVSLVFGDSRVAAGVVQGIGFLGAGLVFQRGGSVKGLTTASTIWVAAAIGLAVGHELYLVAALTAAAVIVMLELAPFSDWLYRRSQPAKVTAGKPAGDEEGDR